MRRRRRTAWHIAAGAKDKPFTITFLTGTFPASITLGANYTEPADASLAEYDAGDGVWQTYTSKTITRNGEYIAFRGDWRDSLARYTQMFNATFQSAAYTCKFSGMLEVTPDVVANVYLGIFFNATAVTAIEDNPLPILSGAPAPTMFRAACQNMSQVTSLPAGFMDTSNLTGAPAGNMFRDACRGMSQVTSLPAGFMDTSGLTGAPAASMLLQACNGMSQVTSLPDGFMDTSNMSGAPAAGMFREACNGMSQVTSLPDGFMDCSNMSGAPAASMFQSACNGMSQVTSLPDGFMDTSNMSGAPAANMFLQACENMSQVTSLPAGFMDTSNMSGAPAGSMFASACFNMSSLTDAYVFKLGAGIDFNSTTVVGPLSSAFRNMGQWSGQVMWGADVLVEAIPVPDSRISTFLDSTQMPDYDTIDANWK